MLVKWHTMLKALIFDFDGLILDTETPEYLALNEVYSEHGHQLGITTYGGIVGSEFNDEYNPVIHLEKLIGKPIDEVPFWERIRRRRLEIINGYDVLPGVEKLIIEGKQYGLKLALASSSPYQWVSSHLKNRNLYQYFDVIKCKDDVDKVKPAPDLFLAAQDALKVEKNEVVIFEDSVNGVIAANKAGIRVITIPNPVTESLEMTGEYLRLKSMADISIQYLLNIL